MLRRIPIKSCIINDPSATVLGGDVFIPLKGKRGKTKKGKKIIECCQELLNALSTGQFCGLITDLEYGRARNIVGENKFYDFLNKYIRPYEKARLFEVMITKFLKDYREIPAYRHLFKILDDKNIHLPNMTSIITAVELKKPIVSYDVHFWVYQQQIRRTYAERHNESNSPPVFTPYDFCKLFLPKL